MIKVHFEVLNSTLTRSTVLQGFFILMICCYRCTRSFYTLIKLVCRNEAGMAGITARGC